MARLSHHGDGGTKMKHEVMVNGRGDSKVVSLLPVCILPEKWISAQSTITNKSRLKLLQKREEVSVAEEQYVNLLVYHCGVHCHGALSNFIQQVQKAYTPVLS